MLYHTLMEKKKHTWGNASGIYEIAEIQDLGGLKQPLRAGVNEQKAYV